MAFSPVRSHPLTRVSIMSSVEGIIQSATAQQSSQIQAEIQMAVAKKQLDAVKQQGDAAVALIQQAADLSRRLDVRA